MGLSYGFLLQFLLAGRIGFYNGPDLARGPPIKNPWSNVSSIGASSDKQPGCWFLFRSDKRPMLETGSQNASPTYYLLRNKCSSKIVWSTQSKIVLC